MSIDRLTIVYKSDSGLLGDLVYVAKKVAGIDSCSLCSITHTYREKPEWRACKAALPVPVETKYRDQLQGDLAKVVLGELPAVVAHIRGQKPRRLLGPTEIATCRGNPNTLEQLIRDKMSEIEGA